MCLFVMFSYVLTLIASARHITQQNFAAQHILIKNVVAGGLVSKICVYCNLIQHINMSLYDFIYIISQNVYLTFSVFQRRMDGRRLDDILHNDDVYTRN